MTDTEQPNSHPANAWWLQIETTIDRGIEWALQFCFVQADAGIVKWGQYAWAGLLLVGGTVLWAYILNWGHISFQYHDWAEGIGHRLAFLQDAVRTNQLPLNMPDASALRNVTDRYLAVADTIFSPQVYMLRYMTLGGFVVFNTVLLYGLGFLGMLRIARRYSISPVPFSAMFLALAFNGRITDLIVVGDIHWAGYFLLPWFVYFMLQAVEEPVGWVWTLEVAVLFLLVFLQGSFHMFVVGLTFMFLLGLFNVRLLVPMLKAGTFAILASMVRILAPATVSGRFDVAFLSGFDSALQALSSMVDLKLAVRDQVFRNTPLSPLGWWEMDHYIGLMGLLFVLGFGLWLWARSESGKDNLREFAIPVTGLVLLSIGRVFKPISMLGIPLLSSQRVSTRFFVLALVVMAIVAAIGMQRYLRSRSVSRPLKLAFLAGLVAMGNDIWQHEKSWRVAHLPDMFPARQIDLSLAYVANHPDPPYVAALVAGLIISVLTLFVLGWMAYREVRAGSLT